MFDELIKKIEDTSRKIDKKDPNLKMLKLVEEIGELSQALLIHQNAIGTKYRNKSEYSIQEEVADVTLCLFSLCSILNIDHSDLRDSINDKLRKWESKVKYDEE
jgi:NTP pyrophosphatase (non-canonical NTP hydrolase)